VGGHGVVDDESPGPGAGVAGAEHVGRVVGLLGAQRPVPLGREGEPVLRLMALAAMVEVGAVGRPFEVHDGGVGLEHDPIAPRPRRKGQVGVLVEGGGEPQVEASKLPQQVGPDEQAGGRAVVDLSDVAVRGGVGVGALAVVPPVAVGPDDAARLLDRKSVV
jgi:hypothetical protein